MNWWYERNGQRAGPITESDLLSQVAQGNLPPNTLVWREGLPQWTSFKDLQSLTTQLPPEPPLLPPPLPLPAAPQPVLPPTAATTGETGNTSLSKNVTAPTTEKARAATKMAPATWYRFFARQIDTCLLALPAVFLAFLGIGLVATPAFALSLQVPQIATFAALVLMCIIGPLVEASVGTLFGNTPGKALFGLKVLPISGRPLTFGGRVKRAYWVVIYGLGFYVPLISLFTGISQHSQIKKNGSTGYDVGLFQMTERPLSGARKFIAMSVWFASFMAILGLNAFDKYDNQRIASPKSWMNIETHLATTIPGGWEISTETNSQGQKINILTSAADLTQVVFASEDVPANAQLEAYISAFVRGVSTSMRVSPEGGSATVAGHLAKIHTGELLTPNAPIEVTFVKRGNKVWRSVVIRLGASTSRRSADELRTALFQSVPAP